MDIKDFPVSNELIDAAVLHICLLLHCPSSEEMQTLKHALHQIIHDHNAQLAKMGFGRIVVQEPIRKSTRVWFENSIESLKEFQAETVESVMGAAPEKMRNSIAYALTTLTVSLCLNKLEKIARSRNGAVAEAVDELQHKIMMALDEFQRLFNASEDGAIGI